MDRFLSIWRAVALGGTAGVFFGLLRSRWRRQKTQDPKQERMAAFGSSITRWLAKGMYVVLGISLIWTLYFLGVGLVDKSQTEYAANAATLIVSFATIFSILIAFYEFMRPGRGGDSGPDAQQRQGEQNSGQNKED